MFHSARNSRRGAKITSKKNYRKTQILNFGISFGVCGDIGRMEIECRRGYYGVLGVNLGSSDDEIRRAYRKLAMQWHPDKWSRTPSLLGQAKEKFQQIQEAYSILSDRTKRTLYDAGLYDEEQEEEDVEGFADFLQEMVAVVNDVRKENKTYSIEELQSMFWDMAQGYDIPMYDSKCFRAANSCQVNMAG